jgi:pimeloyl-ACP methyl ester carboxylesterase
MRHVAVLLGVALLACACATPVGVKHVDTQAMYRNLTANVLSTGTPGPYSQQLLRRLGLSERFEEYPEAVLTGLRGPGTGVDREYLFVLSELSFYHAGASQQREYYLAAAVYAYAFLFADPAALGADPLDPRLRLAANLYNLGLALGLAAPEGGSVVLDAGPRPLPFGQLEIEVDPKIFRWSGYQMTRFVPVGEFEVRGFLNRYRQAGIGAPLAAELTPVGEGPEAEEARKRIPARSKVPVTALLRIDNPSEGIASGQVRGKLEIYTSDLARATEVGGRPAPLELEPTAALAYQLEGAPIWDTELGNFLSALRPPAAEGLLMLRPYRPGRVPVVLIHGTASSPARWADLVNELENDPKLRDRIDFWLFTYNTSNPVLLSASDLRAALQRVVKELDPLGRDPVLRQLVLIGHSQGGLLTRLMVTDSGPRFWAAVTDTPFEQLELSAENRALLGRATFFEPVPFVTRVIFIATPHRGSFRVSSLVLGLLRRLITLPVTLVGGWTELITQNRALASLGTVPNAVDNMSPGHRFVRTLSASPIAPGVTAHSIIPVRGDAPPTGQNDGVVVYESAHLEGIASEKVVYRSSHSTQSNPGTILEVRRILYEHLGIPCGLECEVADRVDAAVQQSMPRGEKAAP